MTDPITDLISKLTREAKKQKRRVKERLNALRGDWVRTPSRGPIQQNKTKCIRWHFWQAAKEKQNKLTAQITACFSLEK